MSDNNNNDNTSDNKSEINKDNLPMEGKLLTRWEIYYYTLVGNIHYWINYILSNRRKAESSVDINQGHQNVQNGSSNQNLKIDVIKDISGSDVTRNLEIIKNMPETSLNQEIINAAKEGSPVIRLGDGSKPRVMITAGVHGNELPPQIAALKMVNHLKNLDLQGTVYIIPFISPKATAGNSKLSDGENLNLVADVPGSPTNVVFNMAQKWEINSLVDCHSTSTHPAQDSIIYYPGVGSSKIAVYVNKRSNSRLLALIKNAGTLISLCNSNEIPSILCEVESPDGTASSKSIEVSFNQMMVFLEYQRVI